LSTSFIHSLVFRQKVSAMHIEPFFDATTGTVSYVLADPSSGQVAVIDPVLDFDQRLIRPHH
jgi:glyoxylase-like metal-dependent hydrolase (beta-lactamase superfamily II)